MSLEMWMLLCVAALRLWLSSTPMQAQCSKIEHWKDKGYTKRLYGERNTHQQEMKGYMHRSQREYNCTARGKPRTKTGLNSTQNKGIGSNRKHQRNRRVWFSILEH